MYNHKLNTFNSSSNSVEESSDIYSQNEDSKNSALLDSDVYLEHEAIHRVHDDFHNESLRFDLESLQPLNK